MADYIKDRVTIKDIAQETGCSISTVHCALNGKSGVGNATRHRIRKAALEMGYKPNSAAASLKRKTVRIAAAFPGLTAENRYYYTNVWKGFRDYMSEMSDFNIQVIEAPYYDTDSGGQSSEMSDLLDNYNIDGLVTIGYMDLRGKVTLNRFTEKHIPIALVGNDQPQSGRICCVQPDYDVIGRVLAELITGRVPEDKAILIAAGDMVIPSHYLIVDGFEAYLKEKGLQRTLYKVNDSPMGSSDNYSRMLNLLKENPDIGGCFSVNTRDSILMGRALEESGLAGKLVAVGSDLFPENQSLLEKGVFTNLFLKKPYTQAYLAAKYLTEYLVKNEKPANDIVYVGSEVIFQSSLAMYRAEHGRMNEYLG